MKSYLCVLNSQIGLFYLDKQALTGNYLHQLGATSRSNAFNESSGCETKLDTNIPMYVYQSTTIHISGANALS
jgi:hypothetical protein